MIVDILMVLLVSVMLTFVYNIGHRKGFRKGAEYILEKLEKFK